MRRLIVISICFVILLSGCTEFSHAPNANSLDWSRLLPGTWEIVDAKPNDPSTVCTVDSGRSLLFMTNPLTSEQSTMEVRGYQKSGCILMMMRKIEQKEWFLVRIVAIPGTNTYEVQTIDAEDIERALKSGTLEGKRIGPGGALGFSISSPEKVVEDYLKSYRGKWSVIAVIKRANQPLEPTTTAVTDRASARSAPAVVVAHL
jgi:hypothetical protein